MLNNMRNNLAVTMLLANCYNFPISQSTIPVYEENGERKNESSRERTFNKNREGKEALPRENTKAV